MPASTISPRFSSDSQPPHPSDEGLTVTSLKLLFQHLRDHEAKIRESISLIPSENVLSPLARLAYLSDGYSRYFFDEHEAFGRWSFQGGSIVGRVQQEVLVPLLQRVSRAQYVDVRSVSGLTAMTTALAAFGGEPGDAVLSVPVANGGHPDTAYVAAKFGLRPLGLPFAHWGTIDLEALADLVARERPRLVYLDHATALAPLDLGAVVAAVRQAANRPVHIHVDSSHVNGLIWGGQLPNPLDHGVDSWGGSTHKTFPGPHKAVIFTNDAEVSDRLTMTAVNMISHHHMSDVIALTVALVEFLECGGAEYAAGVVANARSLAGSLAAEGLAVQRYGADFTRNHQVWIDTGSHAEPHEAGSRLFQAGLIVNPYNPLPSLGGAGLRLGLNEATRMGIGTEAAPVLARAMRKVIIDGVDPTEVAGTVREVRATMRPRFCYPPEVFAEKLADLVSVTGGEADLAVEPLKGFLYS
jgi:glycine/serine hydroxymethyltransferase